jgi:hypothetical protein
LIISKQIDVQNGAVADAGYTSAEPQWIPVENEYFTLNIRTGSSVAVRFLCAWREKQSIDCDEYIEHVFVSDQRWPDHADRYFAGSNGEK